MQWELDTYPMHAIEAITKNAKEPKSDLLLLYGNFCLPHFLPTISAKPAIVSDTKFRASNLSVPNLLIHELTTNWLG